jgi:hypothetical protein
MVVCGAMSCDKRLPCTSAHKEMILKLNDPVINKPAAMSLTCDGQQNSGSLRERLARIYLSIFFSS